MTKGKAPWVKARHRIIQDVLGRLALPYTRWKYGIDIIPFREKEYRPLLFVFNHQTGFDQFFVSMACKNPIYYIASEDIFSLGFLSRLLVWAVNPIPIKKQTSDLRAVRNAMQVAKEGGSIALAPEGNRTFDGKMCYINPAIIGFIRLLKMPVACFRIEGGFGVQPRWSDVVRKGKMKAYVSRVIEPEEYKKLSNEELMDLLLAEMGVDETQIQAEYHSPNLAEYMERAIYVCPDCGLSTFESHGDMIECKQCGLNVRYLPDKSFEAADGRDFPFRNVADWYEYQGSYIRGLDLTPYYDAPVYEDTAQFSEVVLYDRKNVLAKDAGLKLYGNRIEVSAGDFAACWNFDEIDTVTVLGKNKVNIYVDGKVYQIKPDERFNALRYVNLFYHYINVKKGESSDGEFLGL
ncbi:MAG: 1-acyl-sn-glycerol-3-phosphate acyltransferase [Firmicutes bacterium]|nr:1-acyl-sn-glycerol-3-phosphate acyltransferase [Bacillota bacterium]